MYYFENNNMILSFQICLFYDNCKFEKLMIYLFNEMYTYKAREANLWPLSLSDAPCVLFIKLNYLSYYYYFSF
jgi:hypothetical protein